MTHFQNTKCFNFFVCSHNWNGLLCWNNSGCIITWSDKVKKKVDFVDFCRNSTCQRWGCDLLWIHFYSLNINFCGVRWFYQTTKFCAPWKTFITRDIIDNSSIKRTKSKVSDHFILRKSSEIYAKESKHNHSIRVQEIRQSCQTWPANFGRFFYRLTQDWYFAIEN